MTLVRFKLSYINSADAQHLLAADRPCAIEDLNSKKRGASCSPRFSSFTSKANDMNELSESPIVIAFAQNDQKMGALSVFQDGSKIEEIELDLKQARTPDFGYAEISGLLGKYNRLGFELTHTDIVAHSTFLTVRDTQYILQKK